MIRALLAALALAAVAAPAVAQRPQPEVSYQQKTILDITEDENVFGDTVDPDNDIIQVRPLAKHVSLIKVRNNFLPELLKSAERF